MWMTGPCVHSVYDLVVGIRHSQAVSQLELITKQFVIGLRAIGFQRRKITVC